MSLQASRCPDPAHHTGAGPGRPSLAPHTSKAFPCSSLSPRSGQTPFQALERVLGLQPRVGVSQLCFNRQGRGSAAWWPAEKWEEEFEGWSIGPAHSMRAPPRPGSSPSAALRLERGYQPPFPPWAPGHAHHRRGEAAHKHGGLFTRLTESLAGAGQMASAGPARMGSAWQVATRRRPCKKRVSQAGVAEMDGEAGSDPTQQTQESS